MPQSRFLSALNDSGRIVSIKSSKLHLLMDLLKRRVCFQKRAAPVWHHNRSEVRPFGVYRAETHGRRAIQTFLLHLYYHSIPASDGCARHTAATAAVSLRSVLLTLASMTPEAKGVRRRRWP